MIVAPAYYNEYDRHAAAWLRELIADGLIADGVVDERSIEDVLPSDLVGFTQCHFFAGIGGWSLALRSAGWPDDRPVWTGSCPCQPFSTAGKGSGTADERHLWPAWHHLIRERRPAILFGEQVEAAIAHGWLDLVHDDLEDLGYSFGAAGLPAACAGAPHIRQRLWFVAHAGRLGRQPHRHQLGAAARGGRGTARQQRVRADDRAGGQPLVLADSCSPGLEGGERAGQRDDAQRPAAERGGAAGLVGHADGLGESALGGVLAGPGTVSPGGTERLGHAKSLQRSDQRLGDGSAGLDVSDEPGAAGRDGCGSAAAGDPGLLAGHAGAARVHHWANAEWILCRDGKRRPVEPGIQPLAHGISGRVGLLRGSGNAIVPPVASLFIQACEGLIA